MYLYTSCKPHKNIKTLYLQGNIPVMFFSILKFTFKSVLHILKLLFQDVVTQPATQQGNSGKKVIILFARKYFIYQLTLKS